MELTGHEKPLEQYSKLELIQIAKRYTVYYRSESGKGLISNYDRLTKEQLVRYISDDNDYIRSKSNSRIDLLKARIKGIVDPEDIMTEIVDIFKDLEVVPNVGMYCTFIYNAKTVRNRSRENVVPPPNKIYYDQHPLVQVISVQRWGFSAFNYHWVGRGDEIHNYTWNEVAGQLHVINDKEMPFMRTVDYMKLKRYQTI
jgi:hypothetical protein